MGLKFKYKAKEEVPAEAQGLYVERDGAFVLDVEGAVDKARVDEVRASNVALASQLAEQKRRFEGIESEQVKAIAAERDGLSAKLTAIQVDQGVVTVATKKGLRPTAIPDITARARTVFKLVQGVAVPHESDGQTVRVGRDGVTPMRVDEWVIFLFVFRRHECGVRRVRVRMDVWKLGRGPPLVRAAEKQKDERGLARAINRQPRWGLGAHARKKRHKGLDDARSIGDSGDAARNRWKRLGSAEAIAAPR